MICISLTESRIADAARTLERYRERIDLAEVRADYLRPDEFAALAEFPARAGLPLILTLRRTSDGGRYAGPERERIAALASLVGNAAAPGFAYVDLEEDLPPCPVEEAAAERGTRIIRSLHDFSGVPPNLADRVAGLARRRSSGSAEIPKAAVMPRGSEDLLRLLDAYRTLDTRRGRDAHRDLRGREKILLGMGAYGFPTRILARRLGSMLTFCSAEGASAAPGHVDPVTLADLYRYRKIGSDTALYGIIGDPVMHTRSPHIHNPAYRRLGLDAVYLPLQTDRIDLFFEIADRLNVRGVSVTIPHKESVIPFLTSADDAVRAVGACNTIRRNAEGGWDGINTDVSGFLAPLRRIQGWNPPPLAATVIGAGGAARSVVHALVGAGVRVLILNRSVERAERLAGAFGCGSGPLSRDALSQVERHADLLVQTTSVGMEPDSEGDPIPWYRFTGKETAYDLVYAPRETVFLARAKAAGCRTIGGMEMLSAQAFGQFSFFTGYPYPQGLT